MDQPLVDRRQHERYTANGEATLRWQSNAVTGKVTNVSTEGIAVQVSRPIAVGQIVRLKMDRSSCQGSIRSCRVRGSGFLVGVQIAILDDDEAGTERA